VESFIHGRVQERSHNEDAGNDFADRARWAAEQEDIKVWQLEQQMGDMAEHIGQLEAANYGDSGFGARLEQHEVRLAAFRSQLEGQDKRYASFETYVRNEMDTHFRQLRRYVETAVGTKAATTEGECDGEDFLKSIPRTHETGATAGALADKVIAAIASESSMRTSLTSQLQSLTPSPSSCNAEQLMSPETSYLRPSCQWGVATEPAAEPASGRWNNTGHPSTPPSVAEERAVSEDPVTNAALRERIAELEARVADAVAARDMFAQQHAAIRSRTPPPPLPTLSGSAAIAGLRRPPSGSRPDDGGRGDGQPAPCGKGALGLRPGIY